ncbi:MAG: hypothetical protein CSB44_11915 [Gammaproteobacteria bacterium]|nr:MAG: hypothetical protein CSB44_11915 [Gammaproteobacteria bacterium]
MQTPGFDVVDYIALVVFFGAWITHDFIVQRHPWRERTLSGHMIAYRRQWIENMIRRDPKMLDVLVQSTLQQGVLFFASTSILLIGALMAGLGAADKALNVLNDLPITGITTRREWELKILLSTLIFVYAFFKFAWSYRLFNYFVIMIGAAPDTSRDDTLPDDDDIANHANRISEVHTLAARHFTAGVNAYFWALAVISWFISAWLFLAATAWVFLVLYRRAFRSRTLAILNASPMNPNRKRKPTSIQEESPNREPHPNQQGQ